MQKVITVKLKKSVIASTDSQKKTIIGLGLRKVGTSKTLQNSPSVRGMIKKVIHLLEIKE
jgi:large subunit ribosomal protein L30